MYGSRLRGLTAEKLQQLRSALAAFADDPPVTLERYELPAGTITGGHPVAQGAPLLQHLAQIVGQKAAAAPGASAGGETLYRMVVDQRIAGQLAQGLAHPMKAAGGGIYGGILDKSGQLINRQGSCLLPPRRAAASASRPPAAARQSGWGRGNRGSSLCDRGARRR